MSEERAAEVGGTDRRTLAGPAGREGGGQASVDWSRWFPDRVSYAEYSQAYVQQLLDDGRIEELRSAALSGTALASVRLAELYAEQGRIEELRALAGTRNARLALLLSDVLAYGPVDATEQDGLAAAVAVMTMRLGMLDGDAYEQVIELLRAQDRVEEAIAFLQARPDDNEYAESRLLVHLLLVQGRTEDVRAMAGAGGPSYVRTLVTGVLAEQGRIEELRALAAPGTLMARALVRQGRVDEAIAVLQELADADDRNAHGFLISLLVEQGRADQALAVLESRSHNPYDRVSTADLEVARLLDEQGRAEDAIRILSTRGHAPRQLAALLAAQGRTVEAVAVLDSAIAGAQHSSFHEELTETQADLLVESDRIDELRARAEAGHRAYGVRLAAYLAASGQTE